MEQNSFNFPAVTISENNIYFNRLCEGLFKTNRVSITTTTNYLIFSDWTERSPDTGHSIRKMGSRSTIEIKNIWKSTGIPAGSAFRLYKANGGYAIKRYEPLTGG